MFHLFRYFEILEEYRFMIGKLSVEWLYSMHCSVLSFIQLITY